MQERLFFSIHFANIVALYVEMQCHYLEIVIL